MQPSNPALRPSLELLRPAPLRCGEGKEHSEQCGRTKAARPQEIRRLSLGHEYDFGVLFPRVHQEADATTKFVRKE